MSLCKNPGCGTWLQGAGTECADCKRKKKQKVLTKCEYPGCETKFQSNNNRRYCRVHVSMSYAAMKAREKKP